MGITDDKVMMNIEKYGNTTAGTIPLLFWDYEKNSKKGDHHYCSFWWRVYVGGSIYVKWAFLIQGRCLDIDS
jgi:3-oxoacyl-[acyl-carrier-protein] synthase-3